MVYDLTHDNKTYEEEDQINTKAPVSMLIDCSGAFVGSTKGFDQFYPSKVDVTETAPIYQNDQNPEMRSLAKTVRKKIVF